MHVIDETLGGRRAQAISFGTAVAVLTGAALVAATGEVPGWEQGIFHAINGLPDTLRAPMWVFQLLGLLLVPAVVAGGALVAKRYWLALCLVLLIPLKLYFEHEVVKQLVSRSRPASSICDLDLTCGHFRDVPLRGASFVSGHAVIAWAVAWLVMPYLSRRWRCVAIALAVLNSAARVYLGAHNPLDVIGGGALGIAIAALLQLVVQPARRDGAGRARPAP